MTFELSPRDRIRILTMRLSSLNKGYGLYQTIEDRIAEIKRTKRALEDAQSELRAVQ